MSDPNSTPELTFSLNFYREEERLIDCVGLWLSMPIGFVGFILLVVEIALDKKISFETRWILIMVSFVLLTFGASLFIVFKCIKWMKTRERRNLGYEDIDE